MKPTILLVEDEAALITLLRYNLEKEDFRLVEAHNGEEALIVAKEEQPALILLDWMLPLLSGLHVCRQLRREPETRTTPIILLTARGEESDKVRGLESGADDYITKPFNPDELSARVAAVLRRAQGAGPAPAKTVLHYPHVEIDLERRTVTANGEEVRLSRTEWEVLSLLAENAGKVMLHGEMLSRIWGPEFRDEVHYLRTWVSRIRAKLEPDGDPESPLIQTFPGIGYRMESPPEEA